MTVVITRLFASEASAQAAADKLYDKGLPRRALSVISAGDRLTDRMTAAKVFADDFAIFEERLNAGDSLLVVRATYKPLGAAQITRDTLADMETVEGISFAPEHYVKDPIDTNSVLTEHPKFLSLPYASGGLSGPPWTRRMGFPVLTKRKDRKSVIAGGRHMSKAFWPMPLVSKKERKKSVMDSDRRISKTFWPMPLVSKGERRKSVVPGGMLMSRKFGLPTISPRD